MFLLALIRRVRGPGASPTACWRAAWARRDGRPVEIRWAERSPGWNANSRLANLQVKLCVSSASALPRRTGSVLGALRIASEPRIIHPEAGTLPPRWLPGSDFSRRRRRPSSPRCRSGGDRQRILRGGARGRPAMRLASLDAFRVSPSPAWSWSTTGQLGACLRAAPARGVARFHADRSDLPRVPVHRRGGDPVHARPVSPARRPASCRPYARVLRRVVLLFALGLVLNASTRSSTGPSTTDRPTSARCASWASCSASASPSPPCRHDLSPRRSSAWTFAQRA